MSAKTRIQAVLAGLLLPAAAAAADAAEPLVPDLIPWRAHMMDAVIVREGGARRLDFTGSFANIGDGPFELIGEVDGDGTTDAFQRIYDTDGNFTRRHAGTFEFNGHEDHNHFHYAEFGAYRLRAVAAGNRLGAVIRSSDKVGFAMFDVRAYDLSLPNASPTGVYARPGPGDPPGQPQGISVGWADVYARSIDEQWIVIDGVADGFYWLESEVDPFGLLTETVEANNRTWIKVEIRGDAVTVHDESPNLEPVPDPDPEPEPEPEPVPGVAAVEFRAYPNPWRSDAHTGNPLTFAPMSSGEEVVVYTLTGKRVRSLQASGGGAEWDLRNESGQPVASGAYYFIIRTVAGIRDRGTVAVLR